MSTPFIDDDLPSLIDDRDTEVTEGFVIDTLDKAEWALRKKARAEASIERMDAYGKMLKARIDARLAEIRKPHQQTLETMDFLLKPWAAEEVAKANGRKSVKLVSGTVGFRASPDSLEVIDPVAAIAWLKEHTAGTGCIRVKEEVDKREVKKLIEFSGEIPDGVQMRKGDVEFYAKPERLEIEGGK